MIPAMQLIDYSGGYRNAVRKDYVPRPWSKLATTQATRQTNWRMGSFDCSTGPNAKMVVNGYNIFDPMANDRPALYVVTDKTVTATVTFSTPNITWASHTLAVNAPIVFTTTGTLPTGITVGTVYYVKTVATNTFTVAATVGGATVTFSGGSGTHTASVALYDSTRKAIRIEGNNTLHYSSDQYAIYRGVAEDIDGTGTIDCTWSVKVWFDGFVESRAVLHSRGGVEYTIRWMWVEMKFNHEDLPYMRAPYGGCALGACVESDESKAALGYGWTVTNLVDANVKTTPAWYTGQAYEVNDLVYYNQKTWLCNTGHTSSTGVNQPGTGAQWTATTAGYFSRPHELETYNTTYPTNLAALHMWLGSPSKNDDAGTGNPATLYAPNPSLGPFQTETYNASSRDLGYPDNKGGIQKPWFLFGNAAVGDSNSASDRGFWFGLESDYNHRNGQAIYSSSALAPRMHLFFDDAGTKTCTAVIDFIGCTGGELQPSTWSESTTQARYMHDENGVCVKASTNKPLEFEWFMHALPCKPRSGHFPWKRFRATQRWTVEAGNYGQGGSFPSGVPSQYGHTRMSTKPMTHIMSNSYDWMRKGVICPSRAFHDANINDATSDVFYKSWAEVYVDPANDLDSKYMPNVTLVTAITAQTNEAGGWPPAVGTFDTWRGYPATPLMDPIELFKMARLDRGKIRAVNGEFGADFSATNLPVYVEVNWGQDDFRQYIVSEVKHALTYPEINAIYYDNCEVARDNHTDMMGYRAMERDNWKIGNTSSGTAKLDLSNTGRTYTRVNAELDYDSRFDAWGNSITVWPIRKHRETMLELYIAHETMGKFILGHPFGDLTPPLHSFCHALVMGEDAIGVVGVGYEDFNRYPGSTAFATVTDPYARLPAAWFASMWLCGTAPIFLPQFNRHTGASTGATTITPSAAYRAQAHSTAAWSGLLSILHTYEINLAYFPFTAGNAWATATAYVIDDWVTSGGNVYICKQGHTSGAITTANTTYWANVGSDQAPHSTVKDWWDQAGTWRA